MKIDLENVLNDIGISIAGISSVAYVQITDFLGIDLTIHHALVHDIGVAINATLVGFFGAAGAIILKNVYTYISKIIKQILKK